MGAAGATTWRVPSSDGVDVVVHHLAGEPGQPILLVSHATGFHAHCYVPFADELADEFHVVGLDHRGHGATAAPPGWLVDWAGFGDDALAVARELAGQTGGGLVGFGHSMGGAALLMAAHRAPELFDRLVLFEPVAHSPVHHDLRVDMEQLPIVQGARRRRRRFPSVDEAYANFAAKPPLALMAPAALRAYVEHGLRPATDGSGEYELCCDPDLEAAIFVRGRDNGVWPLLAAVNTPTLVIGGRVEARQPSSQTEHIAAALPRGRYVLVDHQTHFGPFSHPAEVADLTRPG